jgi:hypothetical protein
MPFPRRRSSSADWLAVETTWRIRGTRRRDNLTLHQIQAAFTARGPRTIHQRRKVSSANRMIDARTSKYAQRGVDAQSRGCRKRVIGVWAPPANMEQFQPLVQTVEHVLHHGLRQPQMLQPETVERLTAFKKVNKVSLWAHRFSCSLLAV